MKRIKLGKRLLGLVNIIQWIFVLEAQHETGRSIGAQPIHILPR